ncbi:11340_t:CDS:2 [Acaulospora colombiana]|uniref:11340_t:CDS:1 n=1 Tax=Acaulospora colombiana TaxID=27376 RepID=A0ACA9L3H6_9GLOM|nr:11340_t:CDS:2 [Acaulospora colombiana]
MTQPGQVLHGSFNADTSQSTVPKGSIGNATNVQTTQVLSRNSCSGGDSTTTSSSGLSSHNTQLDTSSTDANVPELENKIKLTLLLVSGSRHAFLFEPGDTVTKVKNTVFNEWPRDWVEEAPAKASCLRIVYRGRFLDDDSTLECKACN